MIVRKAHSLDSEWILEQLKIFSSIYETKHELFPKDTKEASLKVLQII